MEIWVQVETKNLSAEKRQQALSAYFIYITLDKLGKITEVPPLLITTEEGQRLFEEGKKRYEERKKHLD
jgi:acyl-CoA hydrolase